MLSRSGIETRTLPVTLGPFNTEDKRNEAERGVQMAALEGIKAPALSSQGQKPECERQVARTFFQHAPSPLWSVKLRPRRGKDLL